MACPSATISDPELVLDEVLSAYLQAIDCGSDPDRQQLLTQHPELAIELSSFFADLDNIEKDTRPLRRFAAARVAEAERLPSEPRPGLPRLGNDSWSWHQYDILGELGQGGMGIVYLARQRPLNRLVAIKLIRPDRLSSASDVERFRNEAETLAGLDHPHIVPIYEIGEHEGRAYLCMKLMEGGSLAQSVACGRWIVNGEQSKKQAARLVATVARAVHHAHQRGILHRDLKPSNILLDAEGRPHIADFGLARRQEPNQCLTETGTILGTPTFMAPEQAQGKKGAITTATDVYGLGAVLYVLLTDRPPFAGEGPLDTLAQVKDQEPELPSSVNHQVDRDMETICLKCLAKEPGARYGSALELAEDLERCLAGEAIRARPTGRLERLKRWCRRNPILAALAGTASGLLLLLVVGLSAGVWLLAAERAETHRQREDAQRERARAEEREAIARRHAYAADMANAWRAFNIADAARLRELLDMHIPEADQEDLRGFEWYYLRRAASEELQVRWSRPLHAQGIFCVTLTADGLRMATTSRDNTAAVWDVKSGRKLFALKGFQDDADSAVFTPDGKILIVAGEDGSIRSCDAFTGERSTLLYQHPDRAPLPQLDVSPDGAMLAAACWDGTVRRFEYPSMRELPALAAAPGSMAESVRFSPDGRNLITSGRHVNTMIWSARTGKLERLLLGQGNVVKSVAVARRQPTVASASYDCTIRLWNLNTGKEHACLTGHSEGVQGVAISPDDSLLASCDAAGSIRLWDLITGRLLHIYPGQGARVWSLAFSPDGKDLLAGDDQGFVKCWDVTSRSWRRRLPSDGENVTHLAPLPDDNSLILCTRHQANMKCNIDSLELNTLHLRSLARDQTISSFSLAPDGRLMAAACSQPPGQVIEIRDAARGHIRRTIPAGPGKIESMVLAADNLLATTGNKQPIYLWNCQSGDLIETFLGDSPMGRILALGPDGHTLASTRQGSRVRIIDLPDRRVVRSYPSARGDDICMAFSADGRWLAVGLSDSNIELWNVKENRPCKLLRGHAGPIAGVAFSPDGRTLASAARDGTVRLWHVATLQEMIAFPGANQYLAVAFCRGGEMLVAGGGSFGSSGWCAELSAWEGPR